MEEQPQYVLKPNLKRLFIPQIFKLAALGAMLYLGVYVNIVLLGIDVSKSAFHIIDAAVALVVAADLAMIYMRYLKCAYYFYSSRVEVIDKKTNVVYFSSAPALSFKRNFLDRVFNTGTILVGNVELKSVENSNQVYFYIQKLMEYGKNYAYNR